jgi:hypothetical protein
VDRTTGNHAASTDVPPSPASTQERPLLPLGERSSGDGLRSIVDCSSGSQGLRIVSRTKGTDEERGAAAGQDGSRLVIVSVAPGVAVRGLFELGSPDWPYGFEAPVSRVGELGCVYRVGHLIRKRVEPPQHRLLVVDSEGQCGPGPRVHAELVEVGRQCSIGLEPVAVFLG